MCLGIGPLSRGSVGKTVLIIASSDGFIQSSLDFRQKHVVSTG
jgi:hypothetical protein